MDKEITVHRISGEALHQYKTDLAGLRIEIFRDFPYLYDGDLAYEENYLETYIQCPESVIVLAFDGNQVIGASTAIPLQYETDEVKQPFIDLGYDPLKVFYCGESVLKHEYRGHGLGVRFFEEREAHANALGRFEWSCFCCVQRAIDHPRRPADYVPLDAFWKKRGYIKHPELQTSYIWKDLDESIKSPKKMTFYLKSLQG